MCGTNTGELFEWLHHPLFHQPGAKTCSPADVMRSHNLIFHCVSDFFTGQGVNCTDYHRVVTLFCGINRMRTSMLYLHIGQIWSCFSWLEWGHIFTNWSQEKAHVRSSKILFVNRDFRTCWWRLPVQLLFGLVYYFSQRAKRTELDSRSELFTSEVIDH